MRLSPKLELSLDSPVSSPEDSLLREREPFFFFLPFLIFLAFRISSCLTLASGSSAVCLKTSLRGASN